MSTTSVSFGQNVRILSLISAGHFLSHFYTLVLPPLFLLLKDHFGVSYAALGFLISIRSFFTGTMQIPAGILVDRIGARPVLTVGLALMAGSIALSAFAPNYWALVAIYVVLGVSSSVFHPTDYTILNSSISQNFVGRAFSIHTFSGHLGTATAPAVVLFLTALWNWQIATLILGLAGFVVLVVMATQWSSLRDDIPRPKKKKKTAESAETEAETGPQGWREYAAILLTKPMLIMALFFTVVTMTSSGMQSFFVTALASLHGTPLTAASSALTGYLFALAGGTLIGGIIADKSKRHDLQAALAFVVSALILLLIAEVDVGAMLLIALMTLSGLMQGIIRPARDMMVRAVVPKGAIGRAFGFVSSGAAIGGALAPVLFGWILDIGKPEWILYILAIFMALSIVAAVVPKEMKNAKLG